MVVCIIAFIIFGILSLFSAKYRPLAKEGFNCVFRTLTLKPCDTGFDQRIKTQVVYSVMNFSPQLGRLVNKQFALLSWIFVLLSIGSFGYVIYGGYNFYVYGNCDGPNATGGCILNDLTGDYGRFSSPQELIAPTNFSGLIAGNESANVTVVEFGCFTCPYTAKAEPLVKQLLAKYNASIRYVFKPFPLPNHNNSFATAQAVLCAAKQGKEWQMRDAVFNQQGACNAGGGPTIRSIAKNAGGINLTAFDNCLANNETTTELERYIQQGKDSHIYATPTFFVNGRPIIAPSDFNALERELTR